MLVKLHVAVQQNTVHRHFITGLQDHRIAYDDIIDMQLYGLSVTPNLAANAAGLLLQFLEGVFIAVLRISRNKGRQNNRQKNAHGLDPVAVAHVHKNDVDQQRQDQDTDDRVFKILPQLIPKGFARWLRQGIIAMFG